jgi:hypothetical protein
MASPRAEQLSLGIKADEVITIPPSDNPELWPDGSFKPQVVIAIEKKGKAKFAKETVIYDVDLLALYFEIRGNLLLGVKEAEVAGVLPSKIYDKFRELTEVVEMVGYPYNSGHRVFYLPDRSLPSLQLGKYERPIGVELLKPGIMRACTQIAEWPDRAEKGILMGINTYMLSAEDVLQLIDLEEKFVGAKAGEFRAREIAHWLLWELMCHELGHHILNCSNIWGLTKQNDDIEACIDSFVINFRKSIITGDNTARDICNFVWNAKAVLK